MTGAEKNRSAAVWGASPAGTTLSGGAAPGTREFFDSVVARRSEFEMPWLPGVIPFGSMRGRSMVEIGCGAGYDALALIEAGARYTGIDITPQNPARTRAHLALYGHNATVLQADAENLPFAAGSFDVAFSNGVLHHTPAFPAATQEVARVFKRGGKFFVIVYHKNSLFYWLSLFLFDQILTGQFRRRTMAERLSMIEYTTSDVRPLVNVYSRTSLRRILQNSGFSVESIKVRKLTADDLPQRYGLPRLWRRIPQSLLDSVGRVFGWYVIAQARKV